MFELKSCPFCGGKADIVLDEQRTGVLVQCEKCESRTRTYRALCSSIKSSLMWAIDNWNQREEVEEKES